MASELWIFWKDVLVEYAVLIAFAVVVLIVLVVRYIKQRKAMKNKLASMPEPGPNAPFYAKENKTMEPTDKPIEPINEPTVDDADTYLSKVDRPIDPFRKAFSDDPEAEEPEDLSKNIAEITKKLKVQDNELDETYLRDIGTVKNEILEVSRKKDMIKKYGRELAKLYDKYEKRENQLGLMLIGLERISGKDQSRNDRRAT
jgi:hypothetical protein